jgi:iron complex outermembrane recepter protein
MNKTAFSAAALAIAQAFPAAAQQTAGQAAEPAMTEVVITAARGSADRASVAGFSETPLLQTPASVSVITREQMQDLNIRSTTDAARYDASISDAYNAVGYAEQFSIRGFKLDNATSYRKDGLAISGDTQIPLENKESIEVLKGLAGLTAGIAAPGGVVNYVTKRPTNTTLRSVLFEVSERGTLLGTVDLGGRFADRRFGYRINVAGERLRSYVEGADGRRSFVSGAFDWQISPQALLQVDADYQKKSQVSAPGFQLINGVALPNVDPATLLNDQPWSYPVATESMNFGARFQYQLAQDWKVEVKANRHVFKRDDYTAFPYGCSAQELYPGFCGNGDYDVYDYRSLDEQKKPLAAQAMLQGRFNTGALTHDLSTGLAYYGNKESWGDDVYEYAGTSNIYRPVVVPPRSDLRTGPSSVRRKDNERAVFVQDIVGITSELKLHAGARYVKLKRSEPGELGVVSSSANFWLPNASLVYSPRGNASLYATYARGLEHGGIAPMETTNEDRALAPSKSKQVEVGAKAELYGISMAAALFQIEKGLEYIDATNTFVRNGEARHRGFEFSAQGKATRELTIGASLAALNTRQSGTGQSIYDGKRVTNVPAIRSTVFAEYAVSPAFKVNGDWQFAGKKAFDEENTVFVPKYHVANFGASYIARVNGMPLVLRAQVRNAFDKFYWRDVTPDLGGYLMPGLGRTFRVSAQLNF